MESDKTSAIGSAFQSVVIKEEIDESMELEGEDTDFCQLNDESESEEEITESEPQASVLEVDQEESLINDSKQLVLQTMENTEHDPVKCELPEIETVCVPVSCEFKDEVEMDNSELDTEENCDAVDPIEFHSVDVLKEEIPDDLSDEESPMLPEPDDTKLPSTSKGSMHFMAGDDDAGGKESDKTEQTMAPEGLCQPVLNNCTSNSEHVNPDPDGDKDGLDPNLSTAVISDTEQHISTQDDYLYHCSTCNKGFNSRDSLRSHKQIHKERGFTCAECSKSFHRLEHLKRHMLSHTAEKEFKCTECGREYIHHHSLVAHLKIAHKFIVPKKRELLFNCTECKQRCFTEELLKKHMLSHESGTPYQCEMCEKSYRHRQGLVRHKSITHSNIKKSFTCEKCNKSWTRNTMLKTHNKTHHLAPDDEQFHCQYCNKAFAVKTNMQKHERIHLNIQYKCEFCDKLYARRDGLAKHLLNVHTEKKFIKCDTCDLEFTDKRKFKQHVKQDHDKEKKYKCEICDKAFVFESDLKYHNTRNHTEKKVVFSCGFCQKGFTNTTNLRTHVKKFHIENAPQKRAVQVVTGGKFKCRLCSLSYETRSSLYKHKLHHRGRRFACYICKKKFFLKSFVRRHLKKMHGIKVDVELLKCSQCNHTSYTEDLLKKHMLSHQGGTPYQCNMCDKSYSTATSVNRHKRAHKISFNKLYCGICDKLFPQIDKLKYHNFLFHRV